jgi:CRP-like cAMP-binding protein
MRLASLFDVRSRDREAQLAHALRAVPLFRGLPAGDVIAVWRHLDQVQIPAGGVVCARGDPGDRFYVLQAGSAEVRLGIGPGGITVRRLGPGDSFGEMALVTGAPRSADVVVAEDAVLWVLERSDFQALTSTSIPLLQALVRDLCDRMAQLTIQVEGLEERLGSYGSGITGLRFGPYRVMEQIGVGGSAVVYKAVHAVTEVTAAIKVLPAAWAQAGDFRERFSREVAVVQRLSHPNLVKVLEVGQIDARAGGGIYLAMEFLPHALDRVLRVQYPEPLAPVTALDLTREVAEALAAVHDAGIVHRDVKPGNILLRADGAPVLTDFGLALARAAAQAQRLTDANVIAGTPDYIAPEQVAGLPLDGRSDVYSLGVVLYELLAAHVPFAGRDPMDTLRAQLEDEPPPLPPEVPQVARAIVEQALQKVPDDRFPSAAAMASALQAAVRELGATRTT